MLLARHGVHFGFQHPEGLNNAGTRLVGFDHVVDEAVLGGDEGVGETVAELFDLFLTNKAIFAGRSGFAAFGGGQFAAVDDIDGALGPHDGNFGGGPGEVDIGADVLGTHYTISAAVGLAGNHGNFGYGGFGEGK